jgi:hypothetical protein
MNAHLTDDQLIRRLYGIGEEEGHLAACPDCRERWLAIQNVIRSARAEMPRAAEISGRRLALQRERILARLDQSMTAWRGWAWVPAAGAATLLAAGLFLSQSRPETAPPAATAVVKAIANPEGDAQLFSDVYSMEQDVEPRAAAPIRGLFQEASYEPGKESRQ